MTSKDLDRYLDLASKNEDLKSQERVLSRQVDNIKDIRDLLLEKEVEFCKNDNDLRTLVSIDALRKRSYILVDHLVHYKLIIECLTTDIHNLEEIEDDEYLRLCLTCRQVEQSILQAIKLNQQRIGTYSNTTCLIEMENRWRIEHFERRRMIRQLMQDLNHFVISKITENLRQQQNLLNQRHQLINNLITIHLINPIISDTL